MQFPDANAMEGLTDPVSFPSFVRVRYEPSTPQVEDLQHATDRAVDELLGSFPENGTIAVGVGSRGIHDIVPIARATIERIRSEGYEPVAIPAMGSHGGATPEGQRAILDGLGMDETTLGCPIDARMETDVIDHVTVQGQEFPVPVARSALEADGIVIINRIKPHTDFSGPFESGPTKMTTIGLGKQQGARTYHRQANRIGYVPSLRAAFETIREHTPLIGGIGIVENFSHRAGRIVGLPASSLPDAEAPHLEAAREWMPTLPAEEIDFLVIDQMGKDISGSGMDTNVIGRGSMADAAPDIETIMVRTLTPASKGNAIGLGMADIVHRDLAEEFDPVPTYTNGLTSGNTGVAALPIVLPTDELGLIAGMTRMGHPAPETVRMAWIKDTGSLKEFHVSEALLDALDPTADLSELEREQLVFEDGRARFEPEAQD